MTSRRGARERTDRGDARLGALLAVVIAASCHEPLPTDEAPALAAKRPAAGETTLAFTVQPSTTPMGHVLTPPVVVTAVDDAGEVVTDFRSWVTLDIGNNPSAGGTLGGVTRLKAVSGVASFDDLSMAWPGAGYTLVASSVGATSATSDPFDITVVPVATVEVNPPVALIVTGGTLQLEAIPKDDAGTPLMGLPTVWATDRPDVATVSESGLVTGITEGSAIISATVEGTVGTSSITVALPPPIDTVYASRPCLDNPAGPVIVFTGAQSAFDNLSLGPGTVLDGSVASWVDAGTVPMRFGGASGNCLTGALVQTTLPDSTSWSTMHDHYAIQPDGFAPVVELTRVHNYGDGVFWLADARRWTLRTSWFSFVRDDCIQNDYQHAGLVEDMVFDGCYVFYSSRRSSFSEGVTGVDDTVAFRRVVARLQVMPTVYGSSGGRGKGKKPPADSTGHGRLWKIVNDGTDPRLALEHVVFRVDTMPHLGGANSNMVLIPPAELLVQCVDVTIVWLGPGDFPETPISCIRVTTSLAPWDSAVAAWHARFTARDTVPH